MHIDLINWLEIIAAVVTVICCCIRPSASLAVLAVLLCVTVGVEFTAKYLNSRFYATKDMHPLYIKLNIYNLYNIVQYSGFIWIMYFLLKDKEHKKLYVVSTIAIALFVLVNLTVGQGLHVYNNYSSAFCIFVLVAVALYKLRTFSESNFSRLHRFAILGYLFLCIFYFAVSFPFYVFYHEMLAQNASQGIKVYRVINNGTNCVLYPVLTLLAILLVFLQSPPSSLSQTNEGRFTSLLNT